MGWPRFCGAIFLEPGIGIRDLQEPSSLMGNLPQALSLDDRGTGSTESRIPNPESRL
jgi:hypothetical protein